MFDDEGLLALFVVILTAHHLTLEGFEGFVGQFRTDAPAHVTVGLTLVLVEHVDNAAFVEL